MLETQASPPKSSVGDLNLLNRVQWLLSDANQMSERFCHRVENTKLSFHPLSDFLDQVGDSREEFVGLPEIIFDVLVGIVE